MPLVRLIHWNEAEAIDRADLLRDLGYEVVSEPIKHAPVKQISEDGPDLVLIDLSRIPSHGREVGIAIGESKTLWHIPIAFVGGKAEKVGPIRDLFPESVFSSWDEIGSAIKSALSNPPTKKIDRESVWTPYDSVPLYKKLGLREGERLALIAAPRGIEKSVGELPRGAKMTRGKGAAELAILFSRSRKDLEARVDTAIERTKSGGLWIAWPKKASGLASDLSDSVVREVAHAHGLNDYKVCSIDKTWSGLRFARKS